ncbi:MAG TPA: DUF1549 domain-containing protein, partial [Verrucomicrobiae bacterium]|nr:DUF1549 domain-containing protein [Verrucomicrobiae bacterium]
MKSRLPFLGKTAATLACLLSFGALAATETPQSVAAKAQAALTHWAFKSPVRTTPPAVNNKDWVRNPIDSFVLARLEKEKLKPSPEADKATLLRRLSLDLIGL